MGLRDYINQRGYDAAAEARTITLAEGSKAEVLVNPSEVVECVGQMESRQMILLHDGSDAAQIKFDLAQNADLKVVQIVLGSNFVDCSVHQQADSRCEITTLVLGDAQVGYTINLQGRQASNVLRGAFVAGGEERQRVGVRVNHLASDCQSDSLVKGIAGGKALGEFNGMVYVAQDAQRTDARQTSRNIEIGREAHIVTKPQLEIYADDVKCSHGATVGQLDGEAILYMRQRGLSEEQAKRMQIEGFLRDVVLPLGEMGEVLAEEMTAKLERL